jgi:hypothetical protein
MESNIISSVTISYWLLVSADYSRKLKISKVGLLHHIGRQDSGGVPFLAGVLGASHGKLFRKTRSK